MGGYNSGGHNRKHVTVEACVRLDAAMLRRAGLLNCTQPTGKQWSFSGRGGHTCDVIVIAGTLPNALEFYIVPDGAPSNSTHRHRQAIRVSYTPCNYGKRRAWLHCPYCRRRCFRLYYYPNTWAGDVQVHIFKCRHCYELTYDARRERGHDLYQSRTMNAQAKIREWARAHGVPFDESFDDIGWDELPDKPKGMRWATYSRLATKLVDARTLASEAFIAGAVRLLGGWENVRAGKR